MKNFNSLLIATIFFSTFAFGQDMNDIVLSNIPHQKTIKYIEAQKERGITEFKNIESTYEQTLTDSGYSFHTKSFFIEGDYEQVWNTYVNTPPNKGWESQNVSFSMLINKDASKVVYRNSECGGSQEGDVIYLNLSLLRGLYNLSAVVEIVSIDPVKQEMIFSYIEGGITAGKQVLQFSHGPNGTTRIEHSSTFKSHSKFRDKVLYPKVHARLITQYHKTLQQMVKAPQESTIEPTLTAL